MAEPTKKTELLEEPTSNGKDNTPILRVGNLFTSDKWYYSDLTFEDNKYCNPGDLLYAWSASFGPTIWQGCRSIYHYHIWRVDHNSSYVNKKWLYFWLLGKTQDLKRSGHGLAMIHITKKGMEQELVALPPLQEQVRIVAKLEEAFAEIDRAEKAYEELQTLAGVLRGQILQEAIQGKLVPQMAEEGVVEQIGAASEEVPFEIPESWKWVKLKSVFSMQAGKFISASLIQPEGRFPCYGGNGLRGYVDISNRKGRFPLIGRQGALCGNVHVVDGEFYATEHAVVVDCGEYGDPDCVGLFLEAMNLNQYATATAQPGLSVKKIIELPFPLPPKDEQARIVSRVKDLMKQVDALSAR